MRSNRKALNICVVAELVGGVGVYGQNLIRGLISAGIVPTVITPTPDRAPGGKLLRVGEVRGRARWLPQAFAFASALRKVRNDFDLVHFTDARYAVFVPSAGPPLLGTMNDYFYAITGWLSRAGTAAVYSDWVLRHLYYNLTRTIEGRCLRRHKRVLCISNAVASILSTRYGLPASQLAVVPYGLAYGTSDTPLLPKHGPRVLFAGGNFQRKGLHVLIKASRAILARHPDVEFVVLGDGADMPLMKKLSRQVGGEEAFRFEGRVTHEMLYNYYRSADIFVMPSIMEAFGIPFLEAMHCGVPVVASDVAGPDDYLVNRANALICRVGSHTDLANCILELIEDRQLRETLIRNGRITSNGFALHRMIDQTVEVYDSVLASSCV